MKYLSPLYLYILLLSPTLCADKSLMVGGWVPYWHCEKAMETAKKHIHLLDQISPFSYEVDAQGTITDPFKRKAACWQEFHKFCKKHKILFVPSIHWHSSHDIHTILSDKKKRDNHIEQIMDTVITNELDGINIDYETIADHDRNHFLRFLQLLADKLHARGLVLHLSIEARTSDTSTHLEYPQTYTTKASPPGEKRNKTSHEHTLLYNPFRKASILRYKKIIAKFCDQIIIMGYDEWGTRYKESNEHLKNKYYMSHSSTQWLNQIMQYALTFIPAHKLVLGLPAYGLEFCVLTDSNGDLSFKKRSNPSYKLSTELADQHQQKPQRTAGGELAFTYNRFCGEQRYICYLDSKSIQERIDMAKHYHLKGVYLFTICGNEDENIWPILQKARR